MLNIERVVSIFNDGKDALLLELLLACNNKAISGTFSPGIADSIKFTARDGRKYYRSGGPKWYEDAGVCDDDRMLSAREAVFIEKAYKRYLARNA